MLKNNKIEQVGKEMVSIGKGPMFSGTGFDNSVLAEIHKEKTPVEMKILRAFELGRRSAIREEHKKAPAVTGANQIHA